MKKVSIYNIFEDWKRIQETIPSYRLGQHVCNIVGLKDTLVEMNGVKHDLFLEENTFKATLLTATLCRKYQWDENDLPCKGCVKIGDKL